MGYYIETGTIHGKARIIADKHNGRIVGQIEALEAVLNKKGVICVVDNGYFEAAGFAYNMDEFLAFTDEKDMRPKQFVIIDRELAESLSNYKRV